MSMDVTEHFIQIIGEKTYRRSIRFSFEFNDGYKNTVDDIIEIYVFIVLNKNNMV
jgi:hypothetical protein